MVEIEPIIDYIKSSRKKGLRDDFIFIKLSDRGYALRDINRAFSVSGKREDSFKVPMTMVFDKTLYKALEKKAKKDGITVYQEMKKIILEEK